MCPYYQAGAELATALGYLAKTCNRCSNHVCSVIREGGVL